MCGASIDSRDVVADILWPWNKSEPYYVRRMRSFIDEVQGIAVTF